MPEKRDPGPSVKNKEMYEALRDQGNSKEKSARIANAQARGDNPGKKGGHSPAYEDWSLEALHERASELDIEGRSSMNKADLIDALRNH